MRKWKKIVASACIAALCLCLAPLSVLAEGYPLPNDVAADVKAKAAICVYTDLSVSAADGVAGRDTILYEKEPDTPVSPASSLRVMMGLYAKKLITDKKLNLDTATGVYTEYLDIEYVSGTGLITANMVVGETWTLRDLLTLSMIQTAADSAATLAATTAGSVEAFVSGMNEYLRSIGCTNSNFKNITGEDDKDQYTTAHDLYVAMRYAMEDPDLSEAMSLTEYTVTPVKNGETRSWENSNSMLRSSEPHYYEPMIAGKGGNSEKDGKALASLSVVENRRYLTVVLGCKDETGDAVDNEDGDEEEEDIDEDPQYTATESLVDWAKNNFSFQTLLKKNQPMTRVDVDLSWSVDSLTLLSKDAINAVVPEGLDLNTVRTEIKLNQEGAIEAPIEKGQVLGHATLYIRENQVVGEVDLVAGESVKRSTVLFLWSRVCAVLSSPWLWALVILLVVLLVAYVILAIAHNREKKRSARNRGKRRYKPMK